MDFLTRLTSPLYKVVVECQHSIHLSTHVFWDGMGVKCLNLPITTGSISSPMGLGSDSLPVKVNMFGVDTYLADSMQFGLELGCRISPKGCYYLMPSFRGEDADESHLCQFFHSEVEMPVSYSDIRVVAQDYITRLSQELLKRCPDALLAIADDLSHVERVAENSDSFPVVSYSEALKMIGSEHFELLDDGVNSGLSITRKGEVALMKHCGGIVWLEKPSAAVVPFYQASDPDGNALSSDLLMGIGEVLGSGERHTDVTNLKEAITRAGFNPDPYQWYVHMKDQSPMRTSGFGLGVERFLMWVLKANDVRALQLLPRENGKAINP
jgi:asparaginyl-tRNA synthetase